MLSEVLTRQQETVTYAALLPPREVRGEMRWLSGRNRSADTFHIERSGSGPKRLLRAGRSVAYTNPCLAQGFLFFDAAMDNMEFDFVLPRARGARSGRRRARSSAMRIALGSDFEDISGTLLKFRALQAFSQEAVRYPVHRVVRCAARRELPELFDALALESGFEAHRLDEDDLMLDGPAVFFTASGRRKAAYTSCKFTIWARSLPDLEEARERLLRVVGDSRLREEMFTVDWHFTSAHGLSSTTFEETADPALMDEAYPVLGEPVDRFVSRYLDSEETVLILQGPPGTGKTRLVRAILAAMSRRKGENAQVLYTGDTHALENDQLFLEFLTGEHDAFVVEDADHVLASRANGNQHLHRFLAIADGVVRAQGRKILFTTNLPNVGDIDDALVRPGRCFAKVNLPALKRHEVEALLVRLCGADQALHSRVLAAAWPPETRSTTLAEVFAAFESCHV